MWYFAYLSHGFGSIVFWILTKGCSGNSLQISAATMMIFYSCNSQILFYYNIILHGKAIFKNTRYINPQYTVKWSSLKCKISQILIFWQKLIKICQWRSFASELFKKTMFFRNVYIWVMIRCPSWYYIVRAILPFESPSNLLLLFREPLQST